MVRQHDKYELPFNLTLQSLKFQYTPSTNLKTCITDREPPVVTCPADIERFTDPGQPVAIVTWSAATATDNSGSVASLTSDFNSGSPFAIGDTTVTYTAMDEAGNTGNCTFEITVIGIAI